MGEINMFKELIVFKIREQSSFFEQKVGYI